MVESRLPEYVEKRSLEDKFSTNGVYALEKKYLLRDQDGKITERPVEAMHRMARTMAEVERNYGANDSQVESFTREFFDIIADASFSPAGRIWTNAGTDIKGLFNCYVLPVPDDLGGIYDSVRNAAIIHKNGGGTGYNFSELRPRGTFVQKSKGIASGVVSFIGQFDKETEVINSGNRRGANMGILDVAHPDILDFVYAKAARGEITNFNVSIGATDQFMQAMVDNGYYDLKFKEEKFTATQLENIVRNVEENKIGGAEVGKLPKPASLRLDSKEIVPGKTKVIDSTSGKVAGRISEQGNVQLYAPYVLGLVADLACKTGDPGMIFLDAINRDNRLPLKGPIRATNPCGEQPLHYYDACNLGSVILPKMLKKDSREIDYEKLDKTVITATRFMDNVNDANRGPIPQVEETVLKHRRIGLGVMGWADLLINLGISYDSPEAQNLAESLMKRISKVSKEASVELAKQKGVFPDFAGSTYDTGRLEDRVRNLDRTTIAPTGTISMVYDVSSGIEPIFALAYRKNIRGGDSLYYAHPSFAKALKDRNLNSELILAKVADNHGSARGIPEVPQDLQELFKTAHDLDYQSHIAAQAAFQKGTDNAVSKTINMPNSAQPSDVLNSYILAWKSGLKGITVYRDGSKDIQVLDTGSKISDRKSELPRGSLESIPGIMPAIKLKQNTPFGNLHMTFTYDPKTQRLLESFGQLGKGGDIINAEIEAISRLCSVIYRSGVSIDTVIEQLGGIGSNMGTVSRDGEIASIPDAYAIATNKFRMLLEKGLIPKIVSGEISLAEIEVALSDGIRIEKKNGNGNGHDVTAQQEAYGTRCPECQSAIARQEGCMKCTNPQCGWSKC